MEMAEALFESECFGAEFAVNNEVSTEKGGEKTLVTLATKKSRKTLLFSFEISSRLLFENKRFADVYM